jgi:4-amino-4-deoxy-L-arabinose transferase-like glycosyltransferase
MTLLSSLIPGSAFGRAAVIIIGLTMLRLVGLQFSAVDLFFDESQYWSWSRDLAFGYFSKPPLLAWFIAAAEHTCGSSEACVRAAAPLLYCGTGLLAYALGQDLYDAKTGFWAALLTALGTGTVFSARIISTDVPLSFFWTLALFAYVRLLRKANWCWSVVLGVAIGAGLLAKYVMIYFLAGMLMAALLEKDGRLRQPQVSLSLAVAFVTVSPNLIWNLANGFLTLRHSVDAIVGEPLELSVSRPLEFLATQFAVFGPVVFGVAVAALLCIGSSQLRPPDRIMLAFSIPPLMCVTMTATVVHVYANWAAASFISLAVLSAAILVRRNARFLLWGSVALGMLVQIWLITADAFANQIHIPFLRSPNPYERTLGWKAYARTVGALARERGMPTIASDKRSDIASLLYYWRDQPEQILAWPTLDLPNFEVTRRLTAAAPSPALFVTQCPLMPRLEKFYATVTPLGVFYPKDRVVRPFHAFRLEEPRGPIGPLAPCQPA